MTETITMELTETLAKIDQELREEYGDLAISAELEQAVSTKYRQLYGQLRAENNNGE